MRSAVKLSSQDTNIICCLVLSFRMLLYYTIIVNTLINQPDVGSPKMIQLIGASQVYKALL